MICLDTNYLIGCITRNSPDAGVIAEWIEGGEILVTPGPAWFEFVCGPVSTEQIAAVRALLREIIPFGEPQAREAARLYNASGRKRPHRFDCMIAGTVTSSGARLATHNTKDFKGLVPHGLKLI